MTELNRGTMAGSGSTLSCLAGKPLKTQIFGSLGCASFPMVGITCVVVIVTAVIVGDFVRDETTQTLDSQMERHLLQASAEIAAATSKRFEIIQLSLLNPVAFAFRDAMMGLTLPSGATGYPISFAGDIRTQDMLYENRGCTERFKCTGVDTTRSAWYFSNESSFEAELGATDRATIAKTKALDEWLEPLYKKHTSAQSVYVGIKLSAATANRAAFRFFPSLVQMDSPNLFSCFSTYADDPAPCQYPGSTCAPPSPVPANQVIKCYDPAQRGWFRQAYCTHEICEPQQRENLPIPQCASSPKYGGAFPVCYRDSYGMGDAILTAPYQDAGDGSWMVTLAKAVYGGSPGTPNANTFLGVVGIDLLLGEIQDSIVSFDMLKGSGFAMLVTSIDGTIVAAPPRVYTSSSSSTAAVKLCSVIPSFCDNGVWTLTSCSAITGTGVQEFEHKGETYFWSGGCVEAARAGLLTHAVIVAVPREKIRAPVTVVMDKWRETNTVNLATVTILSAVTLLSLGTCLFCVSRDITKPIEAMSAAAAKITDAQYDDGDSLNKEVVDSLQSLQTERGTNPDEISDLVVEFARMVQGLGGGPSSHDDSSPTEWAESYPNNPVVLGARATAPPLVVGSQPSATAPWGKAPATAAQEPGVIQAAAVEEAEAKP